MKSGSPSRTTAAHKLKSRPGPLSSSTVVTPHLTLPKLLRGTRDRWVVQVSFITNYSTGLAPFPRLSAPPHSPHKHLNEKNKAKNNSKYQNNKKYEYKNYSNMTLSQTPIYIYIYI